MAGDPNAGMSQPLRALLGETGAGRIKTDNTDTASTVRSMRLHGGVDENVGEGERNKKERKG